MNKMAVAERLSIAVVATGPLVAIFKGPPRKRSVLELGSLVGTLALNSDVMSGRKTLLVGAA